MLFTKPTSAHIGERLNDATRVMRVMTAMVVRAPSSIAVSVRRSGGALSAQTTLTYPDEVLTGHTHRTDDNRVRAIAEATVDALRAVAPGVLESAQVVAVPGRKVALTVVEFPTAGGSYTAYVGSALVRGEVEDALARSVLDAVTNWIGSEETP